MFQQMEMARLESTQKLAESMAFKNCTHNYKLHLGWYISRLLSSIKAGLKTKHRLNIRHPGRRLHFPPFSYYITLKNTL